MSKTQTERLLLALTERGELCAMEPLRWTPPITRVAARVYDLRSVGTRIDTQLTCPLHTERAAHAYYKLLPAADPVVVSLFD